MAPTIRSAITKPTAVVLLLLNLVVEGESNIVYKPLRDFAGEPEMRGDES